jgi:glyoxylase-like metal-dependent hydrolase (beta-lactamase superfamily II)
MATKYSLLHPATFKLDGGAMFGIIPKPLWSKAIAVDDHNRIEMSLRVFMTEHNERIILVDSGIGDYHGEKFDQRFAVSGGKNPLIKILKDEKNIDSNAVTDIILTHLHFDHVGGLGRIDGENFVPIFENAQIHLNKKHFEYSLNPSLRDGGSFQSNYFKQLIDYYEDKNKIHWLDESDDLIIKDGDYEIRYLVSHGHTPHQIHPYDKEYLYLADICPMSHHVNIAWVMGYDMNPGVTCSDKIRIFDFIIEKDLKVIFEHDSDFYGGKISKDGSRYSLSEKYEASKELGIQKL